MARAVWELDIDTSTGLNREKRRMRYFEIPSSFRPHKFLNCERSILYLFLSQESWTGFPGGVPLLAHLLFSFHLILEGSFFF
jgi:hypothetical protein